MMLKMVLNKIKMKKSSKKHQVMATSRMKVKRLVNNQMVTVLMRMQMKSQINLLRKKKLVNLSLVKLMKTSKWTRNMRMILP